MEFWRLTLYCILLNIPLILTDAEMVIYMLAHQTYKHIYNITVSIVDKISIHKLS